MSLSASPGRYVGPEAFVNEYMPATQRLFSEPDQIAYLLFDPDIQPDRTLRLSKFLTNLNSWGKFRPPSC